MKLREVFTQMQLSLMLNLLSVRGAIVFGNYALWLNTLYKLLINEVIPSDFLIFQFLSSNIYRFLKKKKKTMIVFIQHYVLLFVKGNIFIKMYDHFTTRYIYHSFVTWFSLIMSVQTFANQNSRNLWVIVTPDFKSKSFFAVIITYVHSTNTWR